MDKTKASRIATALLNWYARHKRDLPWRMSYSPYSVWLSEIMLQQTTVPHAIPYFLKFMDKYPDVQALAAVHNDELMADWAGLGYYSRARNLHKTAKAVVEMGAFPDDLKGLKALSGVGDYTAGAIMALAYNQQANVVDGNVERVIARVCALSEPLPAVKPALKAEAADVFLNPANVSPRDLPQAFMDLGTLVCTPANPKCGICPIKADCDGFAQGVAPALPARMAKVAKPKRKGFAYIVRDDGGRILLQRREGKGLLGGMAGLPTSDWGDAPSHLDFLVLGDELGHIKHVFTHFELRLDVFEARVTQALPDGYYWVDDVVGLPTVFKKAYGLYRETGS